MLLQHVEVNRLGHLGSGKAGLLGCRDEVNQNVALMALGNEAAYTENDPTAAMKMQFMQQIVQGNPKYQEAL